jgi:PAB1-binding protein PBP1
MDSYRKKRAEDNKKKQKLSSERYNSSTERQNHTKNSEFSNEKVKTNNPKPSVNRSKYQILKSLKPATDNQNHTDNHPEDSLQKLNQKARYKSPKWKVLTS